MGKWSWINLTLYKHNIYHFFTYSHYTNFIHIQTILILFQLKGIIEI